MYLLNSTHHLIAVFLIAFISQGCATSSSSSSTPLPKSGVPDENGVYAIVEEMPRLIGGLEGIERNIVYPKSQKNSGVQGRIFVQFIVDVDGYPKDLKVVRSLGPEFDHAAVAAVMKARFEPGTQYGEPVPVKMSLPITFKR